MKIEDIRKHQQAFLEREKLRKDPVFYNVQDVEIKINPGVFPPATDSRLLAANIQVNPSTRTLDLTTGSGIFSVIAGLQGASGIAVDINQEAVRNAEENFLRYGVKMKAVQSDLFEGVPNEQFDQMFVNGPFFEGDINDPLDYACYGARTFLDRLFRGTKSYLKRSGKMLIILSEWSDLDYFEDSVKKNGLKSSLRDTRTSDDRERKYRLYEVGIEE